MSERQISSNPGPVETRLHCLDMAVRSAALSGRADGLMGLANQYYEWVMQPQAKVPEAKEAEEAQRPTPPADPEVELGSGGTAPAGIPSLRQAASGKP